MTPAAITAAFNLPVHDAEYERLQAELEEVRRTLLDHPSVLSPLSSFSRSPSAVRAQLDAEIGALAGAVQATETRREAEEASLRRKVESLAEVRVHHSFTLVLRLID